MDEKIIIVGSIVELSSVTLQLVLLEFKVKSPLVLMKLSWPRLALNDNFGTEHKQQVELFATWRLDNQRITHMHRW